MADDAIPQFTPEDEQQLPDTVTLALVMAMRWGRGLFLDWEDLVIKQFIRILERKRRSGINLRHKLLRAVRSATSHERKKVRREFGVGDLTAIVDSRPAKLQRAERVHELVERIRRVARGDAEAQAVLDAIEVLISHGDKAKAGAIAAQARLPVQRVYAILRRLKAKALPLLNTLGE